MTSDAPRRVIKLGGSLLEFDRLVPAFTSWLSAQPSALNVIVVGGGRMVDAVRALDRAHAMGEPVAHWLAVRAMAVNARFVHELIQPEAAWVERLVDVSASLSVLNPWTFLTHDDAECGDPPLAESWCVTSDTIAARAARLWNAEELVLLKSSLPAAGVDRAGAAEAGYVDAAFPAAAAQVARVRCVNLPETFFPEVMLS